MDANISTSDINSQERAYCFVKDAILNLEFKPNFPLRTESIAATLSLSRTPVREALSRLEQEGLVVRAGGWGYTVKQITLKEALDLYKVREILEKEAVREAIPNLDESKLEKMRKCLRISAENFRQDRPHKFRETSRKFYRMIAEATENEFLVRMLLQIDNRTQLLGAKITSRYHSRPRESLAENRAVLAALESRDVTKAVRAVHKHVNNAKKAFLAHVMQDGFLP